MKFSVTYPMIAHPCSPELVTREAVTRFARTAEGSGPTFGQFLQQPDALPFAEKYQGRAGRGPARFAQV